MKFRIEPEVFEKFPNLIVGMPVIFGFDNTKSQDEVLRFLRAIENGLRSEMTLEKLWNDPRVKAYLDCFKAFGVDPMKFLPAHVALAKRVLEGGQLPDVNPMVNFYNAMSLKYVTPFGGENLNNVYGDFVLTIAHGGEQWIPIGGDKSKPAVTGELIWQDDFDVLTRALNWRQCDRTKMTSETTHGYFIMDGFSGVNKENIEVAAKDFIELAAKFFGGEAKMFWLDRDNPEASVDFESKKLTDADKEELAQGSIEQKTQKPDSNKVEVKKNRHRKGTISYQLAEMIANAVLASFDNLKLDAEAISLEHPTVEEFGDYSTNVALILAKQLGDNPRKIAEKIVANLEQTGSASASKDIIEKITIAGAGFINFELSQQWRVNQVENVVALKDKFGSSNEASAIGKWGIVIVEYSSPNIAKPFGIGHLRSTIIGDAVQKILKFQGYNVVTDNHLGDWGTQFGKLCYAIKTWGNEDEIFQAVEPIKSLVKLYVRFHEEAKKEEELTGKTTILDSGREWFAKLEKGDMEAKRLWKLCVDASMKEFLEIYELLNVNFDYFNGEAFFEDKLPEIIDLVRKSKYGKENDGALLVYFPDEEKTPLMVLKSDGSTLYGTRDLATDKYRIDKFGTDTLIINETALEQGFYWQQIFEAEDLLGICRLDQRKAVLHGLMLSKDGKKFSTRRGDELWLKEVLDEATVKAKQIMDERKIGGELSEEEKVRIARSVAIGGIKYNDLKQGHQKDIIFDWDKVINLEGDSGPYIQYTYARAKSVLRKAGSSNESSDGNLNNLTNEELAILRWMYRFPEVVEMAAKNYAPNLIASYLFELAKRFNNFYNSVPILGSENEGFKLELVEATSIVLKNGLNLLGIEALERM